jgi:hypothetical protein
MTMDCTVTLRICQKKRKLKEGKSTISTSKEKKKLEKKKKTREMSHGRFMKQTL